MCASWLVRFCDVTVCCMSACATDSGFAVGTLRATSVDARAWSACSPSGVRLAFSLWIRRSSSALRETYRCEQVRLGLLIVAHSYLVQLLQCLSLESLHHRTLLICSLVRHGKLAQHFECLLIPFKRWHRAARVLVR
jgi:hypothetical protein